MQPDINYPTHFGANLRPADREEFLRVLGVREATWDKATIYLDMTSDGQIQMSVTGGGYLANRTMIATMVFPTPQALIDYWVANEAEHRPPWAYRKV